MATLAVDLGARSDGQDDRVSAISFHHFTSRGRHYVLDIDRVEAHDSTAEEGVLLGIARDLGDPRLSDLIGKYRDASGLDTAEAAERINALLACGLLVRTGDPVVRAPIADATDYATFMVNVSQRCNLTCPYCYVNKGHFDYAEVPIPKMPMTRADTIVDHIHGNFPGLRIYGYHFYGAYIHS